MKTGKMFDAKLLVRSAVFGLAVAGASWVAASRDQPPEGHTFERVPVVTGVYRCCENGGRFSRSSVGNVVVTCLGVSYYFIGTGRNDCGLKQQLNGQNVEIEQILVPSSAGLLSVVSKISSKGIVHYEQSDQRVRERWISGTSRDVQSLGFIAFLAMYFAQFVYLNRKQKSSKGDEK